MKHFKILIIFAFMLMLQLIAATGNIEVTDVSPTSLIPGEKSELSFEIENTGEEDLEKIIFSWEEETGNILPIGLSNTKTIEELDEGDDETIDFDVFVSASAEPGLYELTITFTCDNGNSTTSKAGIIVGGQTDFEVAVSDISSSGIILSVANIGKNPAESVTVIIPTQTNFKVSGSSSSIIGNLDKGDYSVASFQINSQTRSSSALNVEIQYTDTMGTRQTVAKIVEVQSSQTFSATDSSGSISGFASQNTNNGNNWFLIAFISSFVLIVILLAAIIRRNKRKNESE